MKTNPKESNSGDFLPQITDTRVAKNSPYERLMAETGFTDTRINSDTHSIEETTSPPQRTDLSRDIAEQRHTLLSDYPERTEHDYPEAVKKYLMYPQPKTKSRIPELTPDNRLSNYRGHCTILAFYTYLTNRL